MVIGDKIRALRKSKNITQTQLAESFSVSSQTVSKWETHLSVPDISVLPEIARYFGITMDELFGYRLDVMDYKERFIRFMVNNGMLKFGEFELKSRRISPYLVHSGYGLTGSCISKLGEFYAECIRENGIEANCLISGGNREVPLVIATSMTLFNKYGTDAPYCIDYGIKNENALTGGLTLVTDTFTSGETVNAVLENIKAKLGRYPSDIVVCVDRAEKANGSSLTAKRETEKLYGVNIHSIVNVYDIINAAEKGVISAYKYTGKIKDYVERYGGI